MNIHPCAKSCPASRLLLVRRIEEEGWTVEEASEAAGHSIRTGYKWLARYRAEGLSGLEDRSSRPHASPRRTCDGQVETILTLRQSRWTGPKIANKLNLPRSTVGRVLLREGVGKLKWLEPPEPVRRYERSSPGELLHVDIKRLARFDRPGHRVTGDRAVNGRGRNRGYEYVHVAIDDFTRLAYVEVLQDQKGKTAAGFLRRAAQWYREEHGILIDRVLSDNGVCYISHRWKRTCVELGIKPKYTRPYRPQTNGKAERFIQTLLRQWAYARTYQNSRKRNAQLPRWLRYYNHRREHGSLKGKSPANRLRAFRNEQGP